MIMAAGVGSRLMPLTAEVPKPMVPIVNKPVMKYCLELLKSHKVTEIIANTHYKAEEITGYFGDGKKLGINMQYSYEEQLLGTAGGVKNNRWFLDETFAIVSGDALTNINLTEMHKFHKEKGALATLALTPVEDVSQYGVVVMDDNNKITAFQEKPKKAEALSNMVNTGIYIFEPEIFEYIPEGVYDFGKELFPKLARNKGEIYGFVTHDYWCDVGSLEVYKQANWDVLSGKFTMVGLENNRIVNPVDMDTSAQVLGHSVIGCSCYIANNAILKDTIIWDNCLIKDKVVIDNAIIGSNCLIEENVQIAPDVVLGPGCVIGEGACIKAGVKLEAWSIIAPGMIVEENLAIG